MGPRKLWPNELPRCSYNSKPVESSLNNLTWAVGGKITLSRHVFLLSSWHSLEIRADHPCWHYVLTQHEMHTIMQMQLKVIKPCFSQRFLYLTLSFSAPTSALVPSALLARREPAVLDGSEGSAHAAGVQL